MARIGIDLRFCSDYFPGIGRATYNFVRALGELEHSQHLALLHNPGLTNTRFDIAALERLPNAELIVLPLEPFALANQWRLPLLARSLRLDLLHTPYYIAPYVGLPCPSIVTIYDIIGHRYPEYLSRRGRLLFETATRLATSRADHILTGSRSARDDISYSYGVAAERISITPFGVEPRFAPQPAGVVAALRARYELPEQYVLYLGANKPHKNLERLLRAWERLQHEHSALVAPWTLVLAGHYDPRHDTARSFVKDRRLQRVRFMPAVADHDLPALYAGAGVFAFVSFYEGFGLPPLEAMACGAPVLCSYASSLPEVVGNAALTVDPFSFIEIAEGLARLLHNPSLRQRLSEAGLRRAREFSWRRTAMATLAVYQQLTGH